MSDKPQPLNLMDELSDGTLLTLQRIFTHCREAEIPTSVSLSEGVEPDAVIEREIEVFKRSIRIAARVGKAGCQIPGQKGKDITAATYRSLIRDVREVTTPVLGEINNRHCGVLRLYGDVINQVSRGDAAAAVVNFRDITRPKNDKALNTIPFEGDGGRWEILTERRFLQMEWEKKTELFD